MRFSTSFPPAHLRMKKTPAFDPPKDRCQMCGSKQVALFVTDYKGIRIFRCAECGIQFMNPQYTDAHLTEYYSHFTFEEPEWDEPLLYCHDFYLSLVERYQPQRGRILDVGTGKGHLLMAAQRRGWNPTGYDVDCESEQPISEKIGMEILCGDFFRLELKPESFDTVYMHQVIEHIKSPVPYFEKVHSILKQNGVLFIAQPNIHSGSALFKFFMERIGVRKKNIAAYYGTEGHLWYYTVLSMKNTLRRFGFEPLYIRSCHKVRAHQSKLKRWFLRSVVEVLPWKSAFLVIARKIEHHP